MATTEESKNIRQMIQEGRITAEEGARLFEMLEEGPEDEEALRASDEGEANSRAHTAVPGTGTRAAQRPTNQATANWPGEARSRYWQRWWLIPMWIGTGITILGAGLMYWAMQATGTGLWFTCAWLPFLLGVAIMLLAWSSRSARWLHLRVHEKQGGRTTRIALSIPIPLRLTAWFLRTFGKWIPHLEQTGIDEIIMALEDETSPDAPVYIEVDEGEGERVQIYIG
jgi:hypothetical protein